MNIYRTETRSLPQHAENDNPDIDRLDLTVNEIGGRKSHMPGQIKSPVLTMQHIPNG